MTSRHFSDLVKFPLNRPVVSNKYVCYSDLKPDLFSVKEQSSKFDNQIYWNIKQRGRTINTWQSVWQTVSNEANENSHSA